MAGRILLDVLVKQGVIGKEKLLYKTNAQTNLAEYYLALDGFCRQSDKGTCLAESIAQLLNIPLLSLSDFDDSLWRDSPSDCWEKYLMIPHREHDGNIYLGMVNPFDAEALQQAEMVMGISLQRAVIDIHDLASFFAESVGTARLDYGQTVREVRQEYRLAGFVMPERENAADEIPAAIDSMISSMICKALEMSASDIHIDAMDNSAIIRFRIDKRLYLHTEIPADLKDSLTMSLLLRSGLDITSHAHPQEGSFQFNLENRGIDVRVAVMPTVQGQRLCLRLLDGVRKKLGLSEIGMGHAMAQSYRDTLLNKPGLIVVAGPTNSGKTTTMHAGLSEFDRDALSIFTLEDPVEYRLAGITQVQVNEKQGFSYAVALRHLLRHDPDIVMIGEVRDTETAKLTIRAALAGHHVICSIHAKDAAAAVARLMDMGVEPYLLAECLNAVIAQRLIRKICPLCHKAGCPACMQSGYHNLTGVFEYMTVDAELSAVIAQSASAERLREYMEAHAIPTLLEDALLKADAGVTDKEEAARIIEI